MAATVPPLVDPGTTERTRRANRATAANWDLFASHRARLTSVIGSLCGAGVARLAIVGAGNCNDIDLGRLLAKAARIQLLDIDDEAVERGVTRQIASSPHVEVLGGVDVTAPASAGLTSLAGCDVIVSACLLSQLILPLVESLGPDHPGLLRLVQQVRDDHLRFLAGQLSPGGYAILVSDFVSSDTCADLLRAPDTAIESIATGALRDRNFFTGTNPLAVRERLHTLLRSNVSDVHLLKPWRWRLSDARGFLVYALTFRTSPTAS